MSEIKTRAEALNASIRKWADVVDRIETLLNNIDSMCGFCDLAKYKTEKKKPKVFRCKVCEPDAKKLCEEYIMDDRLIPLPLSEAWDKAESLLRQLRSLPVDLK